MNAVMLTKRAFSALSSVACWSKIWTGAKDWNKGKQISYALLNTINISKISHHYAEDEK